MRNAIKDRAQEWKVFNDPAGMEQGREFSALVTQHVKRQLPGLQLGQHRSESRFWQAAAAAVESSCSRCWQEMGQQANIWQKRSSADCLDAALKVRLSFEALSSLHPCLFQCFSANEVDRCAVNAS